MIIDIPQNTTQMCEQYNLYLVTEAPNCASLKTIVGSATIRMTLPRISVTPSLNLEKRKNTSSRTSSPKGMFFYCPKVAILECLTFNP